MQPLRRAIVLGGATGLVGRPLSQALRDAGWDVLAASRSLFDPTDREAIAAAIDDFKPGLIYNTVAYTAVDKAEEECAQAKALNATLPGMLGRLCKETGVGLVHYSTDFVFDGKKTSPYVETDPVNPQSVYGKTKLAGEKALAESGIENCYVLRTAWIFGPGKANFVANILGYAKQRQVLSVVHDQRGSPTYTVDLAQYTLDLVNAGIPGLYHLVNSGRASWCELTAEAVSVAGIDCRIEATTTDEYFKNKPVFAKRPAYSVMDTSKFTAVTGVTPRPWVQALREYVYSDLKLGLDAND